MAALVSDSLAAPHLLTAEASNILRRSALVGAISPEQASLAHADLLDLRVELFPYAPFASHSPSSARPSAQASDR